MRPSQRSPFQVPSASAFTLAASRASSSAIRCWASGPDTCMRARSRFWPATSSPAATSSNSSGPSRPAAASSTPRSVAARKSPTAMPLPSIRARRGQAAGSRARSASIVSAPRQPGNRSARSGASNCRLKSVAAPASPSSSRRARPLRTRRVAAPGAPADSAMAPSAFTARWRSCPCRVCTCKVPVGVPAPRPLPRNAIAPSRRPLQAGASSAGSKACATTATAPSTASSRGTWPAAVKLPPPTSSNNGCSSIMPASSVTRPPSRPRGRPGTLRSSAGAKANCRSLPATCSVPSSRMSATAAGHGRLNDFRVACRSSASGAAGCNMPARRSSPAPADSRRRSESMRQSPRFRVTTASSSSHSRPSAATVPATSIGPSACALASRCRLVGASASTAGRPASDCGGRSSVPCQAFQACLASVVAATVACQGACSVSVNSASLARRWPS